MGTIVAPSIFRNVNAIQFNGVDQYVGRDGPNGLTNAQGYVSFWYRPTTLLTSNGYRPIIGLFDSVLPGPGLTIMLRRSHVLHATNNYIDVAVRNSNSPVYTVYAAITTPITAGTWYHVLIIKRSGTSYSIYINNVTQTVSPWVSDGGGQTSLWFGSMSAITSPRLAFGQAKGSYSDCRLDNIVFGTNHLLTSGKRTALYNGGSPVNPHRIAGIDMTHWYRCGESRDDATTLYDEVGGNDLTLTNMDATNYVVR